MLQIVINIRKADIFLYAKQKLFNVETRSDFPLYGSLHSLTWTIFQHIGHHPEQLTDVAYLLIDEKRNCMSGEVLTVLMLAEMPMLLLMSTLITTMAAHQCSFHTNLLQQRDPLHLYHICLLVPRLYNVQIQEIIKQKFFFGLRDILFI